MKRPVLLAALLAAIALAFPSHPRNDEADDAIRAEEYHFAWIGASADEVLQSKCAANGRQEARRLGWDSDPDAHVIYHYSKKQHKCFVDFRLVIIDGKGNVGVARSLSDSVGREYAAFYGFQDSSKRLLNPRASSCELLLPSGEVLACFSWEEFEETITGYME